MTRKSAIPGILALFILVSLLALWSQQAMAYPPGLPIVDTLDESATFWSLPGDWKHSAAYRFGTSGKGLGLTGKYNAESLKWQKTLDLRRAVAPRLRFVTRLESRYSTESMFIYEGDNLLALVRIKPSLAGWREIVIDLALYRGKQIRLEWGRAVGDISDVWMIDNLVVEDMAFPTSTPAPEDMITPVIITSTPTMPPVDVATSTPHPYQTTATATATIIPG